MSLTKLRRLLMSYRFKGTMSPKGVFFKAEKLFKLGVYKLLHPNPHTPEKVFNLAN